MQLFVLDKEAVCEGHLLKNALVRVKVIGEPGNMHPHLFTN